MRKRGSSQSYLIAWTWVVRTEKERRRYRGKEIERGFAREIASSCLDTYPDEDVWCCATWFVDRPSISRFDRLCRLRGDYRGGDQLLLDIVPLDGLENVKILPFGGGTGWVLIILMKFVSKICRCRVSDTIKHVTIICL